MYLKFFVYVGLVLGLLRFRSGLCGLGFVWDLLRGSRLFI